MVYAMWNGPQYRASSPQEMMDAAMAMPMSLTSTLWDQAKGGALESYGFGTALRGLLTPQGNTETGLLDDAVGMALLPLPGAYGLLRAGTQQLINRQQPSMSEDEYKASAFYRKDIPWDEGMTEARAAALADWYDAKRTREHFASKRPITAFIGNLAGQAVDPINYIPVLGPAGRGASILRAAGMSAADAAANTAIAGVLTQGLREQYGDDTSWQALISDVAMAAMIGGAFGGIAGAIGRRRDAAFERQAQERLGTLQRTQEARIALNEAVAAVVRGEDIRLSPNATDPIARVSQEVAQLSRAYDDVISNPRGPVRDPLVQITPDEIDGMIVARGAFKDVNEVEFSKRGWGLVKVIWGHGDQSAERPEFQVSKADVVALPEVVRRYLPSSVSDDGLRREWRVQRDGRTVVYADTMMPEGRHLVTTYIAQTPRDMNTPLSMERPTLPGSRPQAGNLVGDTAGDRSIGTPGAGQDMPATRNIAQPARIDNSPAVSEPLPDGRTEAEGRIATPDNYKALAEQYRIDPETGSFIEDAEIEQLRTEGRLTDEDAAELQSAQDTFDNGTAWGDALRAAVGCLI